MKIYVTKYWETRGVLKMGGVSINGDWAELGNGQSLCKPDWHTTPESAVVDVIHRQIELLAALRKRIRRIQAIKL